MKERPILFSAPMVRAILAGTKTQTRRAFNARTMTLMRAAAAAGEVSWFMDEGRLDKNDLAYIQDFCPYGQPGDRLRVKEAAWMWCERRPNGKTKTGRDKWVYVPMREAPIHYAADHPKKPALDVVSPDTGNTWGWRLKIGRFLPRWASRITLEITNVRVQRLQDISEADAIAEGTPGGHGAIPGYSYNSTPVEHYRHLWESINGLSSWETNSWVWALSFKRVEAS